MGSGELQDVVGLAELIREPRGEALGGGGLLVDPLVGERELDGAGHHRDERQQDARGHDADRATSSPVETCPAPTLLPNRRPQERSQQQHAGRRLLLQDAERPEHEPANGDRHRPGHHRRGTQKHVERANQERRAERHASDHERLLGTVARLVDRQRRDGDDGEGNAGNEEPAGIEASNSRSSRFDQEQPEQGDARERASPAAPCPRTAARRSRREHRACATAARSRR